MEREDNNAIALGSLGTVTLMPGIYLYVGSAFGSGVFGNGFGIMVGPYPKP